VLCITAKWAAYVGDVGHDRSFGDLGSMSGLRESGHGRLVQLLALRLREILEPYRTSGGRTKRTMWNCATLKPAARG